MSKQTPFSKHEFDMLNAPVHCRIGLSRATGGDFQAVAELASREIPGELAGGDVVRTVVDHNPNSLLVFKRGQIVVGGWSMLMLTSAGLEELLLGLLDTRRPAPRLLARAAEAPAAIYVWGVVAPRLASEGIRHVAKFLRQPLYRESNLYSRPNTGVGVALNHNLGFHPVASGLPGLYRYVRLTNRPEFSTTTSH